MSGSNQTPGDVVASPPTGPSAVSAPLGEAAAVPAVGPIATLPVREGRFRRFREWFWRSRAIEKLRVEGHVGTPRSQELLRRGWVCIELAERALKPVPVLLSGAADAPARELARQAIFWALQAERTIQRKDGGSASPDLPALWAETDPALLAKAVGGEGAVHALELGLKLDHFADFSELSAEEQARQARELVVFARALLAAVEAPRVRFDKLLSQRIARTGGAVLLLLVLVVGGLVARSWRDRERDLARGRPFKTSSSYPAVGCKSPEQDCSESPFYFFHTMEEERPWVEIDLGAKKRITALRIANREDCCGERAVPLTVEVSTDHKTWKEIARRDDAFNTWSKDVAPVSARYVRAILVKKGILHLRRFSVLR